MDCLSLSPNPQVNAGGTHGHSRHKVPNFSSVTRKEKKNKERPTPIIHLNLIWVILEKKFILVLKHENICIADIFDKINIVVGIYM